VLREVQGALLHVERVPLGVGEPGRADRNGPQDRLPLLVEEERTEISFESGEARGLELVLVVYELRDERLPGAHRIQDDIVSDGVGDHTLRERDRLVAVEP
jgi:hypothetical protein